MKRIRRDLVESLIDFAPTEQAKRMGFAQYQLEGTVALFNMLARNRVAYLADEVGMGKTYVALGVMALLRWQNPRARIVVIAPRENIQLKWVKELHNFVAANWKVTGNRVKSLQGGPSWEPVACGSLAEFAHEALLNQDRDFFLRMTSFSIATTDQKSRARLRKRLREAAPWADSPAMRAYNPDAFRDAFACALNAVVPDADLVVVDEAHNLKHGFGERVATRNRVMGLAFGHPSAGDAGGASYRHRARRVLLLSATPCEDDYAAIRRQLDVFGFGDASLVDDRDGDPLPLAVLDDPDAGVASKREVVGRLMVRRVGGLQIAGRHHTRNLYRREWRSGGLLEHDDPMRLQDSKERLVVALMQKKVAEVLQSERFNNSFQIGMLSSFESFLQSMARRQQKLRAATEGDAGDAEVEGAFDGHEQTRDATEREGVDTDTIARVAQSYRDRFGGALPHPKLDAAVRSLQQCFAAGEKSLVFVRRVATVEELGARLDRHCDGWLRARMEAALPSSMQPKLAAIWERYDRERRAVVSPDSAQPEAQDGELGVDEESATRTFDDDEGGTETFFSWFFRGEGPARLLSGAAFQKNRLSGQNSPYSILFEDDQVAWLLGRPRDVVEALVAAVGGDHDAVLGELRAEAWRHYCQRTSQTTRYPRWVVFHAYQHSALRLLEKSDGELGERARVVLQERYPEPDGPAGEVPQGFPGPEAGLGVTTVFTELVLREQLRTALWPEDLAPTSREHFRRREQRRELISAMARLGVSYVDLYLEAIAHLGSFDLGQETEGESHADLARAFVDLLERQRESHAGDLCAFMELREAAAHFDLLLNVNFPTVRTVPLHELARLYGATLQRQVPVGRMAGSVNRRLVRQFRMPGFPLVLVTTDVLQEGEDLHTFCRRVLHYGITWTPSAMEQRTGRVDRIGSLVQRNLDGRPDEPTPDEFLQVYYPHLEDTVEVLQVRRVLRRLNRFLELMHEDLVERPEFASTIDATRAMLEDLEAVPPITTPLRSAFPVREGWLEGELGAGAVEEIDHGAVQGHFRDLVGQLATSCAIIAPATAGRVCRAVALLKDGKLLLPGAGEDDETERESATLELRSQAAGDAILLRCEVGVGRLDLNDDRMLDHLLELDHELEHPRICVEADERSAAHVVKVAGDVLFRSTTTQLGEVEALVRRTVEAASRIRREFADEVARPRGRRRRRGRRRK